MPIYEYQCSNCGYEMEELQSMSEEPLVKCPNCGKDTLKRLIGGGAGLIFKGSGFYLTDYKNKPKDSEQKNKDSKPGDKKSAENKPAEKKSTESKQSESKPAKSENKKS